MLDGRIDAPAPPKDRKDNGQIGPAVMVAPPNDPGTPIAASKFRWIAMSKDQGLSWEPGHLDFALPPYVATDSGFIRYVPTAAGTRECLLLSHPSGLYARTGLTVHASFDNGLTWPVHRLVHPYGCQYSDLVQLPDGTIGLLYGKSAEKSAGPLSDLVVFARFNQEWLLAGQPAQRP